MTRESSDTDDSSRERGADDPEHPSEDHPDEYEQFVDFFENSPVPMHWVGSDGTVIHANQAELDALGYAREEYVGSHIAEFHADQDVIDDILDRLRSDEELNEYEARMERKDGSIRHVLIDTCVNWEDGEFVNTRCVTRDITERKERERELEEIYSRISDAFFALDEDWEFTHLNEQAHDVINPEGRDLEGEQIWDAFPAATERAFKPKYERAMDEQETVSFEEYYPDPLDAWFEVRAYPSETGLSVYFQDITERKNRERELEQERRRYETLFEHSNDAIFLLDIENDTIKDANAQAAALLEYPHEELVSSVALSDVHSEHIEEFRAFLESVKETGHGWTDEYQCRKGTGGKVNAEMSMAPVELDGTTYVHASVRDVTERKLREEQLSEREQALRSAYQIIADEDRSVSEQLDDLLAVARDHLGTDYATFSHIQEDRYEFERVAVAPGVDVEAGDTTDLVELPICERVHQSGEPLVLSDVATEAPELVDPEWGIACYLGAPVVVDGTSYGTFCFYDVEPRSEAFSAWEQTFVELLSDWVGSALSRKQATEQLQRQNEQLEEFANVVSHDLRNPLNVAQGRLELARGEHDSDHLRAIETAHTRMEGLIEDLLTLARDRRTATEFTAVDLSALVDACWETVETGASTLVNDVDGTVQADRSRLKQVFENLNRNAVEHGGDDVTLTVGRMENGFYVADDGPGIPHAEREAVFEPGVSTNTDGTGFGLSIVEQVADAHDWEVHLSESETGGARFEITGVEFADR